MPKDHKTLSNDAQDHTQRSFLPAERQDMILSLLTRQSFVSVEELTTLLNTTDITIRRDLVKLSDAGLLKRVRGGAMSLSSTSATAPTSNEDTQSSYATTEQHTDNTIDPLLASISPSSLPAVGVMLPEPSFFWPGVINHMRTRAHELGWRIITRESSYDRDSNDAEIMEDLASQPSVRGLIVAPSDVPEVSQQAWQWIEQSPIPVTVVERDLPLLSDVYVDSVLTNHPYGVRKAATHFLALGHTHIGAAFTKTPTSQLIADSWKDLVASTDRITCPFVLDQIQPYDSDGVKEIAHLVKKTQVTAVLVHSDYLAITLAQSLERLDLRVPEDVSLISIDGFATPSSRPLTVMRSNDKAMAEESLRMLLARLDRPDMPTCHTYIDPLLVDRGSVAKRN